MVLGPQAGSDVLAQCFQAQHGTIILNVLEVCETTSAIESEIHPLGEERSTLTAKLEQE